MALKLRHVLAALLLACSAAAHAVVAIVDDRGRRVELPARRSAW